MPRKKTSTIQKGVGNSVFQPGNSLAPATSTLPEQAVSLGAQLGQFNALQPTDCYQMSIPVRSCIQAIATNIGKATPRVFDRKTGDEVLSCPFLDLWNRPAKAWNGNQVLNYVTSFHCISGEWALNVLLGASGQPMGWVPIAPTRLQPLEPLPARDLSNIRRWLYTWDDGVQEQITPDSLVFYRNFNPSSSVRGCSPLITGVNEASCGYFGMRFNMDFYRNSSIPSHILVIPERLSKKQRDDVEQRYFEQFSNFNGNAHKVLVVSGTTVDIKKLDSDTKKDGDFIPLMQWSMAQIAALFKVPATEIGLYDKSRFETAAVEREMFFENTLTPLMHSISETVQDQILDRYYPGSSNGTVRGKGKKLGKYLRKKLDDAFSRTSESDLVFLLDPDSLPISSQLQLDRFASVRQMCDSLHLSVNEACEYLGIEIPYSPIRDKVFVPNTYTEAGTDAPTEVTAPLDQDSTQQEQELSATGEQLQDAEVEEPLDEPQKELRSMLQKGYRELRRLTLRKIQHGQLPTLAEADAIFGSLKSMKRQVRRDLASLRRLSGPLAEREVQVKKYFNGKTPGKLTRFVRGIK